MKIKNILLYCTVLAAVLTSCQSNENKNQVSDKKDEAAPQLEIMADRFADIQVLRYDVPGFNELSLQQKQLAYYLYQAGLSGRDIHWDQKYKHNLQIRKTLETILSTYSGDKNSEDYNHFVEYCKRVFFANGIHHHYSNAKFLPEFSFDYFKELVSKSDNAKLPLEGMKLDAFTTMLQPIMFDPKVDAKAVDLSPNVDIIKASAGNFYEDVTQKEAETFYNSMMQKGVKEQPSYGLNSKLIKENGKLKGLDERWNVRCSY